MKLPRIFALIILLIMFLHTLLAQEHNLPFSVGEKLVYNTSFGIVPAGTFTLMLSDGGDISGYPCYLITSNSRTNGVFDLLYKIRDETESYWDTEKFVVRKFIKRISEGSWKQYRIHYYFPEDTTYYYVTYKKDGRKQEKSTSLPDPQDTYTIIYWVRLQELAVGDTLNLNISLDGDNHPVELLVEKKETLDTIFGKKDCFKITPNIPEESQKKSFIVMDIWVTDDEYKIPVKLTIEIKYGTFTFKLKDAENVELTKK
ncbi:MAG TPA: DUF3108 domain-containing protein [Candidatus Cloacimonetes bacterium]|nr:DUF3108 domain-containing protein [Candidatus Cloacimonadota bacterium]HEX37748.1 DUF3108 domain-containing protein [Candidatus Cloacimonadota bacterium]